jgi:translation initiation factor IF-1
MVKEKTKTETGTVMEALPNTTFRVRLAKNNEEILAHLSGKMRIYRIKVVVGDKVELEPSADRKRGRIIKRL